MLMSLKLKSCVFFDANIEEFEVEKCSNLNDMTKMCSMIESVKTSINFCSFTKNMLVLTVSTIHHILVVSFFLKFEHFLLHRFYKIVLTLNLG